MKTKPVVKELIARQKDKKKIPILEALLKNIKKPVNKKNKFFK